MVDGVIWVHVCAGSSPVIPMTDLLVYAVTNMKQANVDASPLTGRTTKVVLIALSPSGKAQHFDCCIRLFESTKGCCKLRSVVSIGKTLVSKTRFLSSNLSAPALFHLEEI